MNTLYFTRAVKTTPDASCSNDITFVFTAESEEAARERCMSMIAEFCRHEYKVDRVEVICQTPDVVECFEPV